MVFLSTSFGEIKMMNSVVRNYLKDAFNPDQLLVHPLFYNKVSTHGDIVILFGMPGLRIKVNSPILPILILKLVAKPTSLERSEIGGQVGNLRSNTY